MSLGVFEIIDFADLSKEKKERLKANCYEIMKLLVLAEKTAMPLLKKSTG